MILSPNVNPQAHTPEISEKQGQANLKNKNCHI